MLQLMLEECSPVNTCPPLKPQWHLSTHTLRLIAHLITVPLSFTFLKLRLGWPSAIRLQEFSLAGQRNRMLLEVRGTPTWCHGVHSKVAANEKHMTGSVCCHPNNGEVGGRHLDGIFPTRAPVLCREIHLHHWGLQLTLEKDPFSRWWTKTEQ